MVLEKGLNFRITREFLVKIENGKGQDGKGLFRKQFLQFLQFRKGSCRLASVTGCIDDECHITGVRGERDLLGGSRTIGDGESIDGFGR